MSNNSNKSKPQNTVEEILSKCRVCNFCVDYCPVFKKAKLEPPSRANMVMDGIIAFLRSEKKDPAIMEYIEACTLCGACGTIRCPARIHPPSIFLHCKKIIL